MAVIDPQQVNKFLLDRGWTEQPGAYPFTSEYTHADHEGSSVFVRCTNCYINFADDEGDGEPIPTEVIAAITEAFPHD